MIKLGFIIGILLIIIGQCAGCSHDKKVQLYQKYSPDCCGMNSDSPAFIYQRTHYCATVEEMKEYRRLQTIPDWYDFDGLIKSKITDLIGDGWTIEVIKHIFKGLLDD